MAKGPKTGRVVNVPSSTGQFSPGHHAHHPLMVVMSKLYEQSAVVTASLYMERVFSHVAAYVVTLQGEIIVQGCRSVQAFGGCRTANSIFRMVNSLRLELMDESSLLTTEAAFVRASPLYCLGDVLVQVFVYDRTKIGDGTKESVRRTLFSPERSRTSCRERGLFSYDIVLRAKVFNDTEAQSIVRDRVPAAGRHVYTLELSTAHAAKWRSCDRTVFDALLSGGHIDAAITGTRECVADADVGLIPLSPRVSVTSSACTWLREYSQWLTGASGGGPREASVARVLELVNLHDDLACLRRVVREPWYPLLWTDAAKYLQSFSALKCFVEGNATTAAAEPQESIKSISLGEEVIPDEQAERNTPQ
eukprot:PhM_4_TR3492/c0_g1_i2/m.96859